MLRLLRFIFLIPTLLVLLPVLAIGALVIALVLVFKGSPGACDVPDAGNPALALAYEQRWIAFNEQLFLGQPASMTVTDAEATSRGRLFLAETGAPVDDLYLCFHEGESDAAGVLDSPFGGDVRVRLRGSVDLSGAHPEADIESIELGGLPGFVTKPFHGLISRVVEDQTSQITLNYPLDVELREGEATIRYAE